MSVRAPSLPALGLERSGAAFDYLFITPGAVCFLQPNPAPALLAVLDFAAINGLEWNGENLFIEPRPDAEITIAEAITGWGTKLKRLDVETAPAERFFDVWTRWRLRPTDLRFAERIASSAGLSRHETEVGTTTWEAPHNEPKARSPLVDESASSPSLESEPQDQSHVHSTDQPELIYAGVTDMIGQLWLVEVDDDTIVRALKLDDWYEIDVSYLIADGRFDPEGSRQLIDERLETQEDVDDGLLELRVSEEGLPYDVIPPSAMR